ncbi:MAG TPA: agmatine deiminase family protein, partial [Bacteroidota bacterium]|nr:agmatine deiminase family protein [Bacteroidota bacterium]
YNGQRIPASYINFLIANGIVMVPTFRDPKDAIALEILQHQFQDRVVVGIDCVDLVWGLGTLHCISQQEPLLKK